MNQGIFDCIFDCILDYRIFIADFDLFESKILMKKLNNFLIMLDSRPGNPWDISLPDRKHTIFSNLWYKSGSVLKNGVNINLRNVSCIIIDLKKLAKIAIFEGTSK